MFDVTYRELPGGLIEFTAASQEFRAAMVARGATDLDPVVHPISVAELVAELIEADGWSLGPDFSNETWN
jgi:hypothetical protein